MTHFEEIRRRLTEHHKIRGTKATVSSDNSTIEIESSAGVGFEKIKIFGASSQPKVNFGEVYKEYFNDLTSYVGLVTGAYAIPLPEAFVGKELTFSVENTGSELANTLSLSDNENPLFASSEALISNSGEIKTVTSSLYTYLVIGNVMSVSEITTFWENYSLVVTSDEVSSDLPQPIYSAGQGGLTLSCEGINLWGMPRGRVVQFLKSEVLSNNSVKLTANVENDCPIFSWLIPIRSKGKYSFSFHFSAKNSPDTSNRPNEILIYASNVNLVNTGGDLKTLISLGGDSSGKDVRFSSNIPSGYKYIRIAFYASVIRSTFENYEATLSDIQCTFSDNYLPFEPYIEPVSVVIPSEVSLTDGEELSLRLGKYQNADYIEADRRAGKVKYFAYSTEGDPTKPLCEQPENNTPIEYDLTDADFAGKLLSLNIPYDSSGSLSAIPNDEKMPTVSGLEVEYYSASQDQRVTLTVDFIDTDGAQIAQSKQYSVRNGARYLIIPPHIDGYLSTLEKQEGFIIGDTQISLIYTEDKNV